MSPASANTLWARAFVDELARAGVREVVLAPGSRSTPLVMAFAMDGRFRLRVHLDERSAGFFALGVGKATGVPAAVVTTSGTATANLFPAVVEASQSEVPMVVLTADRPHHLRDADANQAIDQLRLFGPFVRAFFEVAPPVASGPHLRHLRTLAGRSVAEARGVPSGPVHLNFPFGKPLEPESPDDAFAEEHPIAARGREGETPFVRIHEGARRLSEGTNEATATKLRTGRGVIVAGPSGDPGVGDAALALAARTGFPILADPLSGARYGDARGAHRVAGYDLFLRDASVREVLEPSLILRVGASPTSAPLLDWILHHSGVPHLVVDAGARWKDHGVTATEYLRADPEHTLTQLARLAEAAVEPGWCARWQAAEDATMEVLASADPSDEGRVAAAVVRALPAGGHLFVSNSMPVRDVDAFGAPRAERITVHGNRGASGIDGIVSTAFGIASQADGPTTCLLGDIALFHDQNGLLWAREAGCAVVFVLVDNDGGAIFHALPIARHEPHFTEYFATPHGLDFHHAAALHGIELRDIDATAVEGELRRALGEGRTLILRVRTDRRVATERRRGLARAVGEAARRALAPQG